MPIDPETVARLDQELDAEILRWGEPYPGRRFVIIKTPANFVPDPELSDTMGIIGGPFLWEMTYILALKFGCSMIVPGLEIDLTTDPGTIDPVIPQKGCSESGELLAS
jgi:hypothetical protein